MSHHRRRRLLFTVGAAMLAAFATNPAAAQQRIADATVEVRSHAISVAGRLEPRTRVVHSIPSAGFVDEIPVSEGQRVATGDTLLTIRRRDDVLGLYQPVPLTARVAGRIAEISVSTAEEVQSGQAAVVILGTDGYVVETAVSDKDAFHVEPGQGVRGETADGTTVSGTLLSRSQEPDYETGLFSLRFAVPAQDGVRIGQFLVFQLPTDRVEGVFVPRTAVVRRFGADAIWTVTAENTLAAARVEVGDAFDGAVHIRAGLEEGTRFLVEPTGRERDGAPAPTPDGRGG